MNETPQILVVDDEMMIHIILDQLIRSYGFEPIKASNAEEAEQQLKEHAPDLILLDIVMPGSDSKALLQSIKDNPKLENSRVIMISGTNDLNKIASYIDAGADDYILKPFHATLLKTRILHALERIKQQQKTKQTQSKLAETQLKLQQAEATGDTFCSELSHDLNNALTGITMTADLLLLDEQPENVSKGINEIMSAAEQASEIIQKYKHSLQSDDSK